jgi:RNA polymerase sigma-70 factor (ECF subfamily)
LEELIERAKNNDKNAYTELINIIAPKLLRIARIRLDNMDDVNDAINETIIISYENIKKLKNSEFFTTWIIRILINQCNKIYSKNKRRIDLFEKVVREKAIKPVINNSIQDFENRDYVEFLLNKLNYNERVVIELYYSEQFTIQEISKVLKQNENTIMTRLKRAKEKMQKYAKEEV